MVCLSAYTSLNTGHCSTINHQSQIDQRVAFICYNVVMQLIHVQYLVIAIMTDNHYYIAGSISMPQKVKVKLSRDPEGNYCLRLVPPRGRAYRIYMLDTHFPRLSTISA